MKAQTRPRSLSPRRRPGEEVAGAEDNSQTAGQTTPPSVVHPAPSSSSSPPRAGSALRKSPPRSRSRVSPAPVASSASAAAAAMASMQSPLKRNLKLGGPSKLPVASPTHKPAAPSPPSQSAQRPRTIAPALPPRPKVPVPTAAPAVTAQQPPVAATSAAVGHPAFIASSPRPAKIKRDDRAGSRSSHTSVGSDVDSGASDSGQSPANGVEISSLGSLTRFFYPPGTTFGQPPKKRVSPSSSPRIKAAQGKKTPRSSIGRSAAGVSDSESDSENVSLDLASMQDSLRDVETQVAQARSAPKRTHVARSSGVTATATGAASSSSAPAAAAFAATNLRVTRSQVKTQQAELFSPTYHLSADPAHPRGFRTLSSILSWTPWLTDLLTISAPKKTGTPSSSSSPRSSRHPSPSRERRTETPPSSDDETENDENRTPDPPSPNAIASSSSSPVVISVSPATAPQPEPSTDSDHEEHPHHGHHAHMEVDDTVEDPDADEEDEVEEFDP